MKQWGYRVALVVMSFIACTGEDPDTDSTPVGPDGGTTADTGGTVDSGGPGPGDGGSDGGADSSVLLEGKLSWATTFATGASGEKVAVDASGNVYVVGRFTGSNVVFGANHTFSATLEDGYVVKLNSSGTVQWARQLNSTGNDVAYGVAVDSAGDVYVSGMFQGPTLDVAGKSAQHHASNNVPNGFIAKLSKTDGAGMWAIPIQASGGGASAICTSLVIHNATDLGFNCSFQGTLTYAGTTDSFADAEATLAGVLDASNGALKWSQLLRAPTGSATRVIGGAVELDSSGNLYVGGLSATAQMNLRTGVIASSAKQSAANDGFVVKIASGGGATSWIRMFGAAGGNSTTVAGLRVDPKDGSVYAVGQFDQADFGKGKVSSTGGGTNADAFVVKLTSSGNTTWQKTWGGSSGDTARGVDVDGAGNVVVGGNVSMAGITIDGKAFPSGPGFYVTKLDPTTAVAAWVTGRTSSGELFVRGVAVSPTGEAYATGQFTGAVDFLTTVTAKSAADAFVVGLTP
jgi:hypothetical protein